MEAETQQGPKPLLSGVIYGQCAFWIAVVGFVVSVYGVLMSSIGPSQFFDMDALLNGLWAGKDAMTIWQDAAGYEVMHGHWYLKKLAYPDGIAMLGIGITCLGGVIGAWGAFIGMLIHREKPRIFTVFAAIISIILTASALGLISLH